MRIALAFVVALAGCVPECIPEGACGAPLPLARGVYDASLVHNPGAEQAVLTLEGDEATLEYVDEFGVAWVVTWTIAE